MRLIFKVLRWRERAKVCGMALALSVKAMSAGTTLV